MTTTTVKDSGDRPVLMIAFQHGKRADGGLESLYQIARALPIRPILLTQIESPYTEKWRALGAGVEVWPAPDIAKSPLSPARMTRALELAKMSARLVGWVRRRGVSVIHCNDGSALALALPAAKLTSAKLLLNIRDTLLVNRRKWILYRSLCDEVVVLSAEMRAFVERELEPPTWFGRPTPVTSVYSGVDFAHIHPPNATERLGVRRELGIGETEFAIGLIGALVPKKQQLELLEYLRAHPESLPEGSALHLVGDFDPEGDEYSAACAAVAADPTLSRVRLHGYSARIGDWYRALDLTVLVSRNEGLARSTIESIASATPVVAFDFCSAREILEGHDTGVVIRSGDYSGLFRAVNELAKDPKRRRYLGESGVRTAHALFTPERIAARYAQIYRALGAGG